MGIQRPLYYSCNFPKSFSMKYWVTRSKLSLPSPNGCLQGTCPGHSPCALDSARCTGDPQHVFADSAVSCRSPFQFSRPALPFHLVSFQVAEDGQLFPVTCCPGEGAGRGGSGSELTQSLMQASPAWLCCSGQIHTCSTRGLTSTSEDCWG